MKSRIYKDVNLTVHEYVSSSSSARSDHGAVLREGRGMVEAATAKELEWIYPKVAIGSITQEARKSYIFNGNPPAILAEERVKDLKEWGSPVSEDEIFYLRDLQDFVSADLQYILRGSTTFSDPLANASNKRIESDRPMSMTESKRRKLNMGSLYSIIPQPHIHPSPYMASDHPPKAKPFKKAEPVFIAPYSALPTSDVRLGWLIPVRGTFSWENCTSGEVLDRSSDHPCPVSAAGNCISWTKESLLEFWDFLLCLRKVGSLGSLGISFHSARFKESARLTSSVNTSRGTADSSLSSSKLASCDYIKVYHDASKALYVRSALDVWQYVPSSNDGREKKIRLLKGARLVLLDEASRGVLTL